MHHVVHVINILGTFVATTHDNLFGIVHVLAGYLLDARGHGSREEEHLAIFGNE